MVTAKCIRCGGSAEDKTFSEASTKINHAVGLSRGIKCGKNYDRVVEVGKSKKVSLPKQTSNDTVDVKPKTSKPKSSTK